jgi:transcriptional regulator with XRE-family HTH domain
MTATLLAETSRPIGSARVNATRRVRVPSGRLGRNARRNRRGLMAFLARLPGKTGPQTNQDFLPVSVTGVIGGAVIRAARKSARINRRKLARILTTSPHTIRNWENGTSPLFLVTYDDLGRLAAALDRAGAKVQCDLAELMLAAQCDLLIAGMLRGFEDYAEVPPVDEDSAEGEAARDLLRWALAGVSPERYRAFAPARPLLAAQDANAFSVLALRLSTGLYSDQLVRYGRALSAITTGRPS